MFIFILSNEILFLSKLDQLDTLRDVPEEGLFYTEGYATVGEVFVGPKIVIM